MVSGDFNGDGHVDFVHTSSTNSQAVTYLGNGSGGFSPHSSMVFNGGAPAAADLNNDGAPDLMSVSGTTYRIYSAVTKSGVHSIASFDVSTIVGAREGLNQFRTINERIGTHRSVIGALQSRVGVSLATLNAVDAPLAAAEGRLRDIDVASESSELVRLKILQKIASAVLAGANQSPALSLRLLGD